MLTFNTITASDSELIENFVNKYEPYSDFNFVSIYSWSKHSQAKYCINNDCLYLIIPDYTTQKPIFTFLCHKNYRQNLNLFILWLKLNSFDIKFDLLPQVVAKGMEKTVSNEADKWILYEDRGSFDYILDTLQTRDLEGSMYSDIRYKISLFDRTYGDSIEIREFNPSDKKQIRDALKLGKYWAEKRNQSSEFYEDELFAYSRFLDLASNKPHMDYISIYSGGSLIALASFENINDNYSLGHFLKFNPEYKGVYYKLVHEVCKKLCDQKIKYINIEQDLGISGLRKAKEHLRPVSYLKKYSLTLNHQN